MNDAMDRMSDRTWATAPAAADRWKVCKEYGTGKREQALTFVCCPHADGVGNRFDLVVRGADVAECEAVARLLAEAPRLLRSLQVLLEQEVQGHLIMPAHLRQEERDAVRAAYAAGEAAAARATGRSAVDRELVAGPSAVPARPAELDVDLDMGR